jgi:hypothetical protein
MHSLTIYFDDPWWVGIIACDEGGALRVYRHVFGSEPSGEEVLAFVLREYVALTNVLVAGVMSDEPPRRRPNPKRAAREAASLTAARGISTKAQEALRVAREAEAAAREAAAGERRERDRAERWEQSRVRTRERRRGH